jgi:hypothetical protein
MPQLPVVGSEVVIQDNNSQYKSRNGVVVASLAATDSLPARVQVAIRPFGSKPNTSFNNRTERRVFRLTQVKVIDGSGSPGSVEQGNAATDTRIAGQITAGHPRFVPSPADRKDAPGSSYNGVEAKATAASERVIDYCNTSAVAALNTESEQYANLDLVFPLMGFNASTSGSTATELRQPDVAGINNDVELVPDRFCTVPKFNSDGGSTGFFHYPNV